jgi:hypothetical protein
MKNKIATYLLTFPLLLLSLVNSLAQGTEADISAFLNAEAADANKMINAYVGPGIRGLSYGMASGWFTTAKTHKLGGFDVNVTMSAVFLPTSDETFDPTKIGLSANTVASSNIAPTVIGPKSDPSYATYKFVNNGVTIPAAGYAGISGPEGLDLKKAIGTNAVPVPMVQAGIGLLWNTDLKIRLLPQQKSSDGKNNIQMLGFGLMHDIKQHIPGMKLMPFDLSVIVAYNSISGNTALINTRTDPNSPYFGQPNVDDGVPYSSDGKSTYTFNSWLFQALISKKLSVVTFYGGIGYGSVTTKAKITGSFVLDNPAFRGIPNPAPITIKDPFSTNYTNNGMKLTLGMRLKFGPIYLNGDYTIQSYNVLTVGFGVSVR